ncbi:hypothetical protein FHW67_000952 [Herbaspirillum sp. Sphag1AN]|uniref:DUF2917 domain-containing protein n=1 Tax=unclassified Herbaspirillum TaxID=2624150 RepID=UPI0016213633|nr:MULTISPECIES: DUF2917 domain-containing protein [unclassified Herbaspirillum]MBB3211704.1 hypothetical protein [Herbaspirillum sp. Sphag1AN]MBB3245028.1 hypothetical protein [Herbaspirillum sp. Sphag64]
MKILDQERLQYQLSAGNVVSFRLASARLLVVRRGMVWITQEGRSEDFWLRAGDGIIVSSTQLLVIEAEHDSELALEPAPSAQFAAAANWFSEVAATLGRAISHLLGRPLRRHRVKQKGV